MSLIPVKARNNLFITLTALCGVTAIYHVVGVFYVINDSPPWRHLLFVAINLLCAYGFLKRPQFFVYLFAILLVQQFYSHGSSIVNMWVEKKQIDWISIAVLIFLPVALVSLFEDYRLKRMAATS